jgi:hypothetical protein
VAILRAPEDEEEAYRIQLAHSPRFQALLENSRQSIREGKGLSHDEFWKIVEERAAKRQQAKKGRMKKQRA